MHDYRYVHAGISGFTIVNIRNTKKNNKVADKVMYSQLPKICIKGVNDYSNDDLTTPSM